MLFKRTLITSVAFHAMVILSALLLTGNADRITAFKESVIQIDLRAEEKGGSSSRPREIQKQSRPKALKENPTVQTASVKNIEKPVESNVRPEEIRVNSQIETLKKTSMVIRASSESEMPSQSIPPIPDAMAEIEETKVETITEILPALPLVTSYDSGIGSGIGPGKGDSSGISIIRNSIESAKSYPPIARKRRLEGTVLVEFRVSDKGQPIDLKVVESSGHQILDSEAVRTIHRAGPYPRMNKNVEVPIVFRLSP